MSDAISWLVDGMVRGGKSGWRRAGFSLLALASVFLLPPAQAFTQQLAPVYSISVLSGKGSSGSPYTGDGGPALQATSGNISDVVVDSHGNIYFSDNTNCVVRRVDAVTGVITTVAGVPSATSTSNCGAAGDGGPAGQAQLGTAWGLAFDNSGNLLIVDKSNNAIRKLDFSTGNLTTVVGELGLSGYNSDGILASTATLKAPWGVFVDKFGNTIVADYSNSRIREVSYATQLISTIAGTGKSGTTGDPGPALSVMLDNPAKAVEDAAGNILIGDHGSSAILELYAAGSNAGNIVDIAGVRGKSGTTLGAGNIATASYTNTPLTAVDDLKGNVFFADEANDAIRQVNSAGVISTIAGALNQKGTIVNGAVANAAANLNLPYSITNDWADNIYIASTYTYQIAKLSYNTQQPTTAVGSASAAQNLFLESSTAVTPQTAAITPSNEFAIGALSNCSLGAQLAAQTACQVPITFTPAYPGLRSAQLAFTDASGNVSQIGLSGIGSAPLASFSTASVSTIAGSSAGALNAPRGGVVDSAGNVYFADSGNNVIRRIAAGTGAVSIIAGNGTAAYGGDNGPATQASLNAPSKVALDYAGNLYISDTGNNVIRKVSAATGLISTIAGNGVAGYAGDGGSPTAAELSAPHGIALDPGGRVYVADTGNNAIRYFGPGGSIGTIVGNGTAGYAGDGTPAGNAELSGPTDVAVDQYGDIYIADTGNDVVRVVTSVTNNLSTFGNISTFAGVQGQSANAGDGSAATAATLAAPTSVAVDAAGDVYIAAGGQVRMVNAAGVINTIAGTGAKGSYSGEGGAAPDAVIPAPAGNLALDGAANLYIFNTGGNRVLKVSAFAPAKLDLGQAPPHSTGAAQTVLLTNTGNSTLTLATVTPSANFTLSPDATACAAGTTLQPGQNCTLSIAFSPSALGTANGSVTVTDNMLNSAGATQTIALTGLGKILNATQTGISFLPTALVYGTATQVTAQVTGGVSAGGAVVFKVNGTSIGSVTLGPDGKASIALPMLPAGPVSIQAAYSGDDNNSSSSYTANVTVQQVQLTVTANNATLPFGATAMPQFTYTITGFVNGDTASSALTGAPSENTTATLSSPAGSYPITIAQGTLMAVNYSFKFVNGTLTIQPPPPPDFTLTATPAAWAVAAGKTATVTLTLTPLYGYAGTVALSCSGLPSGSSCGFTGPLIADGKNDPYWTQVKIYTSGGATMTSRNDSHSGATRVALGMGMPLCFFGIALFRGRRRVWAIRMLALLLLAMTVGGATSCMRGGVTATKGTYPVVVTAADQAAGLSHSTTITLTIQ